LSTAVSRPQSLFASGTLSLLTSLWGFAIGFVALPIMVGSLGYEDYGAYGIAFALVSYGSILELGLGWSIVKFIAEADERGRHDDLRLIVVAGAAYQLLAGIVIVAVAMVVSVAMRGPGSLSSGATLVAELLPLAATCFVASNVLSLTAGVLRGLRRFLAASLLVAVAALTTVAGPAAAAACGAGVRGVVAVQLVGGVGVAVVGLYVVMRWMFAGHAWPSWEEAVGHFRRMLSFSLWSFASRVVQIAALQGDKAVAAWMTGAAGFAFYSIPFGLAQKVNFLGAAAMNAIYPVAAASAGTRDRFLATYFLAARIVHLVTGAGALTAIALSPLFLASWIGPEMAERGSVFLRLFVLGYWVVAVGSLDGGCVEAWGYPRATATVASAALAVAVVAGIVCYLRNVDVLVSLAVAVTVWLVTTGVGNSAVWYRIGGIYVRRMWLTIGLPLLEMAALAGLAAALLNPLRVHRAAGLLSLLIVAGALVGYGWLRMFAASERRGLVLRMKGFMSGGEGW
jgi:O-antigen/teichoic acid export membrane protein